MSLPEYSRVSPAPPPTLAEAVARARWPRNRATVQLAPHRDELLRLHQAGDSVGSLVVGLRQIGVEIGRETLRLWLNRELGRRPAHAARQRGGAVGRATPVRRRGIRATRPRWRREFFPV